MPEDTGAVSGRERLAEALYEFGAAAGAVAVGASADVLREKSADLAGLLASGATEAAVDGGAEDQRERRRRVKAVVRQITGTSIADIDADVILIAATALTTPAGTAEGVGEAEGSPDYERGYADGFFDGSGEWPESVPEVKAEEVGEREAPLPWETDETKDEDPAVEPLMRALSEVADRGSYTVTRDHVIEAVALLRTSTSAPSEPPREGER